MSGLFYFRSVSHLHGSCSATVNWMRRLLLGQTTRLRQCKDHLNWSVFEALAIPFKCCLTLLYLLTSTIRCQRLTFGSENQLLSIKEIYILRLELSILS